MKKLDRHIFTRYLVTTAILGALAFVLQMLGFPLPFVIPVFIKFDFSDLPALVASFSMGPLWGMAVALIKNALYSPIALSNPLNGGFPGLFANFTLSSVFVGIAGLVYRRKKSRAQALIGSLTGALALSLLSVPINLFITYPFYYTLVPKDVILGLYKDILPFVENIHTCLWYFNAPFNLFKGLVVAAITFAIYKHISPLIKGVKRDSAKKKNS